MNSNKTILAASIILSLGIVIGFLINSFKPFQDTNVSKAATNEDQNAVLINIDEASKLLGFSKEELKMIISAEKKSMAETGVFDGTMLPYVVVNGKQYFERTSLLKWAVEGSTQHREYQNGERYQ